MSLEASSIDIERVPSGVPGLDEVLAGGFLRGGVYLVTGTPGAGKTILSNQIAFHHVHQGGRAVYVTLLAESHSRLMAHIRPLDFFDPSALTQTLHYLSGYQAFEREGMPGLLDLLRRTVQEHRATLLIVDGIVTTTAISESELVLKKFVHALKAFVELAGCTALVLTSGYAEDAHYSARTMVDGILSLGTSRPGLRTVRELEVLKLRGSAVLLGRHLFSITKAGISVYPRLEAQESEVMDEPPLLSGEVSVGIPQLDQVLGGGFAAGTVNLILGMPGSGKTLMALNFLAAGAARGERGLYYGFYEPPARLLRGAEAIGIRLAEHVDGGLLAIQRTTPVEQVADAIARDLLDRAAGAQRVVLDGVDGLRQAMAFPERIAQFLAALAQRLRWLGVTALFTAETQTEHPASNVLAAGALSTSADSMLLLRYRDDGRRMRRYLSVLKKREGQHDPSSREFRIHGGGFELIPEPPGGEIVDREPVPSRGARPPSSGQRDPR